MCVMYYAMAVRSGRRVIAGIINITFITLITVVAVVIELITN